MTTLTLTLGIAALTLAIVLLLDRLEQKAAKRDRRIMRQLHTYMAQIPPARERHPW